MVRYFSRGKEVSWERMVEILDRREAALRGTCAWILLGKKIGFPPVALGLANVKEVIYFLSEGSKLPMVASARRIDWWASHPDMAVVDARSVHGAH